MVLQYATFDFKERLFSCMTQNLRPMSTCEITNESNKILVIPYLSATEIIKALSILGSKIIIYNKNYLFTGKNEPCMYLMLINIINSLADYSIVKKINRSMIHLFPSIV